MLNYIKMLDEIEEARQKTYEGQKCSGEEMASLCLDIVAKAAACSNMDAHTVLPKTAETMVPDVKGRTYEGKRVYTSENFCYSNARKGDYVEESVVDGVTDMLPPVYMTSTCVQVGEPYSYCEDPDTGKWLATYITFKFVALWGENDIWEYCGHCFLGENVERGRKIYL